MNTSERTGHRSLEGVCSYKRTTSEQQENVWYSEQQETLYWIECSTKADIPLEVAATASMPSYMASKTGAFTFHSYANVNINFNNYTGPHNLSILAFTTWYSFHLAS